jgi:hypothetical protein
MTLPTAPQITAAVAELRQLAIRRRRQAAYSDAGTPWRAHYTAEAAAFAAVADWLATPIPAPEGLSR